MQIHIIQYLLHVVKSFKNGILNQKKIFQLAKNRLKIITLLFINFCQSNNLSRQIVYMVKKIKIFIIMKIQNKFYDNKVVKKPWGYE